MTTRVQFQEKPFDIFIGRPSKWSNPFPIRKDRSREEAVRLYEKWIRRKPELLADLHELEGKVLGCWCKEGELCHGDVLIRLLDEMQPAPKVLYKSTGVLNYTMDGGYRLAVEVDQQLADYYRALIPPWKPVNRPRWGAHITVVRPEKEQPVNLEPWGKYHGEPVQFLYEPSVHEGKIYYWLNIWCSRLEEIRTELGLPVISEFTLPPEGFIKCFHCTIGNCK